MSLKAIFDIKSGTCRKEEIVLSESEITEIQDAHQKYGAEEFHRPLTQQEVTDILIKAQVNTVDIADSVSVRMKAYYPTFSEIIGQTVKQGFKFQYGNDLYKTIQPDLTIQEHYPPGTGTESLYTKIDEEHLGNKYDPIPYSGNMALEYGKYYTQDDVVYLCNRDTVNPVHNALSELVGIYVKIV